MIRAWAGVPASITHGAPLTCPSCGREVAGYWYQGREPEAQHCPSCGHVFEATWPGWTFEPETVIIEPSGEANRRGAA